MEAFLQKLSGHIFNQYKSSPEDICVVLPNRRAGLFLKKYLGERFDRSIWAPHIISIEDLMFDIAGLARTDQVTLLFELYEVHKEISKEDRLPLDQFLGLGKIMISDFNEIDMYLVDPEEIFNYLSDAKALTLWNVDGTPLSEFQQNYLQFFRSLKDYYISFNNRIRARGIGYQGMAYRSALEKSDTYVDQSGWSKVIFAGLNALSLAEEELIKSLLELKKAEVFWDADTYYLDDRNHEAGHFLRRYFKGWSRDQRSWIEDNLLSNPLKISIAGTPRNVTQARYTGNLLKTRYLGKDNQERTAIVLADEKMLVPLLNSLPEEITDMNVTMGYPLRNTSLSGFFKSLFRLKESPEGGGRKSLYVPDLFRILQHAYLRMLLNISGESESIRKLNSGIKLLRSSKQLYYQPAGLEDHFAMGDTIAGNILRLILKTWTDGKSALDNLTLLTEGIKELLSDRSEQGHQLETEYLFEFSRIIRELYDFLEINSELNDLKALRKVFTYYTESTTIPFYGEPLKGIQIMGMLETRALDFENIILLSVNENILPAPRSFNSFIPVEMKNYFRIPTFKDKDAIYGYHFYRLLQRASNVHIIYNTENDEFGKGEKSRFINQLLMELPYRNSNVRISEEIVKLKPETGNQEQKIIIKKDKEVADILNNRARRGFSSSSLSTYINCSLQFYFRYILGIREEDELEETIQSRTLGDVVHTALHNYYKPFEGKKISDQDIITTEEILEKHINKAFLKKYKGGDITTGLNLLLARLALLFFRNFLKSEKDQLTRNPAMDIIIRRLEGKLVYDLPLNIDSYKGTIPLLGFLDRVDQRDGLYQILDYKTGSVEKRELKFDSTDELLSDPDKRYPFQLMIYSLLLWKANGKDPGEITAGIFSLRKPSQGIINLTPYDSMSTVLKDFEEGITGLIATILDPSGDFQQAEDIKRCKYCDFREICNR